MSICVPHLVLLLVGNAGGASLDAMLISSAAMDPGEQSETT